MKTIVALGLLSVATIAQQAHAVYDPEWERPIESAQMKIIQSRMGFQQVHNVQVTLTRRDGSPDQNPTGMILKYGNNLNHAEDVGNPSDQPLQPQGVIRNLVITHQEVDECGSVHYTAGIPQFYRNNLDQGQTQIRFTLYLVDHSHRTCADRATSPWEASIRQGYGWCGTLDATMSLTGTPEPVITMDSQ